MAVNAKKYKLNDIDINVIHLHEYLMNELTDVDAFLKKMHRLIKHYNLTCSAIGDVPNNIDEISLSSKIEEIPICDLLIKINFASSKSEAKRMIQGNGVRLNNEVITDINQIVELKNKENVVKFGKNKLIKIV